MHLHGQPVACKYKGWQRLHATALREVQAQSKVSIPYSHVTAFPPSDHTLSVFLRCCTGHLDNDVRPGKASPLTLSLWDSSHFSAEAWPIAAEMCSKLHPCGLCCTLAPP